MSEEPQDVPVATPVTLEYATPTLAGDVPDLVPIAEAAIKNRASIRRVGSVFRKPTIAAEFISRSLRRRFAADSDGGSCGRCGATTSDFVAYGWSFVVPSRWWVTVVDARARVGIGRDVPRLVQRLREAAPTASRANRPRDPDWHDLNLVRGRTAGARHRFVGRG